MHEGLDIAAPVGRPVRASKAGVAVRVEAQSGYGNLVIIDHGAGETTRYAHLSRFLVAPGQPVAAGQVIAEVGNTGRSTGPHLHFSLVEGKEYVDPLKALPAAAASTLKRPGKEFHDSKGQIVQALASLEDEGPVKLTRLSGL